MAQEEPRTASDERRTDSGENSETETGPSSMNFGTRDPDDLMPHPINEKIYGDEAPEWFVETIDQNGMREPVEIIPESHFVDEDVEVIVSGHRRVDAAVKLGLDEIPVILRSPFESKLDERHAIVESNKQRDKNFSQQMQEAELLARTKKEKTKRRIKQGAKAGGSKGPQNLVDPSNKGEIREKVAETIGWSKEKLRYSQRLWETAQNERDEEIPDQLQQIAESQVEKIDAGDQSPYGAYREIKTWEETLDLGSEVTWDEIETVVDQEDDTTCPPIYAESVFDEVEADLSDTESLWTLVATIERELNSDSDRPDFHDQGLLALFLYRLEQDGYVVLSEQAPKKPDPLTAQKPHAETLRTMYWEEELPVRQMGLILGVHEYVVYQWLREGDISLRMDSFSADLQEAIGKHRSDADS